MTSWISRVVDFSKRNKYHFIGWVVFIVYEVGVIGVVSGDFGKIELYLLYYFLNILLFYTHSLTILPFALGQQKSRFVIGITLTIFEYLTYILIIYTLVPVISNSISYARLNELSYFILITGRYVYFLGFSSTYYLFRRLKFENIRNIALEKVRFDSIIERKEVEYELIKSNYAYLRAQINPHFLFNLLSFLYDRIKNISVKAADAIHVLSDMMRYSIGTTDKKELVSVSEELEQTKNLIYLNQLRFDNKLQISLDYSKEVLDLKILPLVLLTLVENMFKHGSLINPNRNASIHIYVKNEMFFITTVNALAEKANNIPSYRSGLENIKKRLELAYGSAVFLECSINHDKFFSAHIGISVLCLNKPINLIMEPEIASNFEKVFSHQRYKAAWIRCFFSFFKKNRYHFFGWFAFIAYEVSAVSFANRKFDMIAPYLIYYPLHILLFYCHALFVLPYSLSRRKHNIIMLCLMIVLEYIIYLVSFSVIIPPLIKFFEIEVNVYDKFDFKFCVQVVWRFLYFVSYSWTYYLFRRLILRNKLNIKLEQARFQDIIKKKDIEQELIRSNYAYLRAQINPHFLFNLLNFLYDEVKKSSQEVSEAIMVLSEMMQYSLGGLQQEFVAVSEEIEQVEHLIYLHQFQCENTLQIEFSYSDEVVHLEIIPLVLLTLIENMFKHGDFTSPNKKASINVYIDNNVFHIVTINHLRIDGTELGHGTGLDNIKRRLAFAYSGTENVEFFTNEHHQFVARVEIPVSSIVNPRKADAKV